MTSRRWMALCFALGSGCFLVGPFPGYAQLVGASAVGVTFFVGSILFTLGGGVQSVLAWPERRFPGGGRAGGPPSFNPPARCSSMPPLSRRCTRR